MSAPSFTGNNGVSHSDNAIHDSDDFDWDDATIRPDAPANEPPPSNPYDDLLQGDDSEPDAGLLAQRERSPKAKQYEKRVRGLFSTAIKVSMAQPKTLPDSAALMMHGTEVALRAGDLAAENPKFARAVDFIVDNSENATAALLMAVAPLALQIVRNHEPVVESTKRARTLRIPFTKRQIRFKIGFKLGRRMRMMTEEPNTLTVRVFTNPKVVEALSKQGISVES